MSQVYAWMFVGLLVTFMTGYVVSSVPAIYEVILNSMWYLVFLILELVLVFFLSARITKMSGTTAKMSFILYSLVSGVTFSSIFLYYDMSHILYVFLTTSIIFGLFAVIGYVTETDLTKLGNFLLMALIGGLVCVIINIFVGSSSFDLLLSIVFVLVFIGFTAYDVQRIKKFATSNQIQSDNLAIYGALELYLDFINIFLELLNITDRSR